MWLFLFKQEFAVSFCFSWNAEKKLYKNSPWLGGSFLVQEVVGEVCLRLTLGVLLLMLLCQSIGLVKIALKSFEW